jgi:beta-lactamase regulating signal transducer with metallopeptidase domain
MSASLLHSLESILFGVFEASWQASILALLVVLLQKTLRSRLNPRWSYALWLVVLLRLALPIVPESPVSLFGHSQADRAVEIHPVLVDPSFDVSPLHASAAADPIAELPANPIVPARSELSLTALLAIVWAAGALILLALTFRANRRFLLKIRRGVEITDHSIMEILAAAKSDLKIRRHVRLVESPEIQSPAIVGIFKPTLLLPADFQRKFENHELRFIFLHELAHLKRGDTVVQWIVAVLQSLHWFNPVVWLVLGRIRADREGATDALVLSHAGEEEKERYGLMLVKLLEHFSGRYSLAPSVGVLEGREHMKLRFSLISRFKKGGYRWSVLGILLVVTLSVVGLTKAAPKTVESEKAEATDQQTISEASSDVVADAQYSEKLVVHVVGPDNQPLEGVALTVTGWRPREDPKSVYWGDKPSAAQMTDAQGNATVSYPPRLGPEDFKVGTVIVRASKDGFCVSTAELSIDEAKPVRMERGTLLAFAPEPKSGEKFERIIVRLSSHRDLAQFKYSPDGQTASGALLDGHYQVRLAALGPNDRIFYSKPVLCVVRDGSFTIDGGPTITVDRDSAELSPILLPMKKGVSVAGSLDANIPRPIKNGWVAACVASPVSYSSNNESPTRWFVSADVDADGKFTLPDLPTGVMSIIAGCDGYVSQETDYNQIHPNPMVIAGGSRRPLHLRMQPTGSALIEVLTPEGKPLPGATVSFWPGQTISGGGSLFGLRTDTTASLRGIQPLDYLVFVQQFKEKFSRKTDDRGIVEIQGLPPGLMTFNVDAEGLVMPFFEIPSDMKWKFRGESRRAGKIEIVPGDEVQQTVKMERPTPAE